MIDPTGAGGADRAQMISFREGGAFEQGIKGDISSGAVPFMRGLPRTHYVIVGGFQAGVYYQLAANNEDGLWNRFLLSPCLATLSSIRE